MTDVHQQIDHLKCQIDTGAEETKVYLDQLKKKVEEFDAQHKLSETATSYLESGIDSTRAAVDELKHVGAQLQQQSAHASHQSIDTAQRALCQVKDSLHELQCKASEYDRKFASSTGSRVSEGIESVVNAARQRTTDAIEMANEQAMRVKEMLQNVAGGVTHTAQVATGEAVKAAELVDEKLGVTPKVASAVGGVTGTVKSLDKRMHVTETAVKIDEKITGGLGSKVLHKGVEMVQESIEYVTETLHQAKLAANKSPTTQAVEERASGVAQQASETAGIVQDEAMAAKDQAQATASSAQQKVKETAGAAKDKVTENPMVQQGQEMAGSAMEKGQELKEGAQQKGREYMAMVKEKGSHVLEGGQQMKEIAKQKGSVAMQSGHEMKKGAKQKGSKALAKGQQLKEGVKQKGSDAMEKGKQTMSGGSSSTGSGGGSTIESMKEKATDLGTATKAATMGMSSGKSATDMRHKQPTGTSGDEGLMQQTVESAKHTAEHAKEKMADTMSRQKGIMKDATKM